MTSFCSWSKLEEIWICLLFWIEFVNFFNRVCLLLWIDLRSNWMYIFVDYFGGKFEFVYIFESISLAEIWTAFNFSIDSFWRDIWIWIGQFGGSFSFIQFLSIILAGNLMFSPLSIDCFWRDIWTCLPILIRINYFLRFVYNIKLTKNQKLSWVFRISNFSSDLLSNISPRNWYIFALQ